MKKRGLGKGLEALLGDNLSENQIANVQVVALKALVPNPYQPRKVFDQAGIETLADSIRQHGVIQPLAVRAAKAGVFEIIAGERRCRAAKLAGLKEVPVVVHDVSDSDSAAFALIENLQREDLNVIEKAKGIAALIDNFKLTHEACGQVLGQSRSAITNTLRLLDLDDSVQQAVAEKTIDMGHARALLAVDKAEQQALLQKVRLNGLSVRETEALVKGQNDAPAKAPRHQKDRALKQVEAHLSEVLQAKVNISQQAAGNGKISVAFSDSEMLQRLIRRFDG